MSKRNSKPPVFFMLLVLLALFTACQSDKSGMATPVPEPAIDFDAVYVESDEPGDHVQVLLKMSLLNIKGDILKYGISTPEEHQQRLHYYMQDFKNHIQLISGADTLSCVDSHFERLNMDLPYRNFVLTFHQATIDEGDQLIIDDPVFTKQLIQTTIRNSYD